MKRVYTERHMEPRHRRKAPRKYRFSYRNPRLWGAGIALAVILIFVISCLLTAADANIGSAIKETVTEIKAPQGSKPEAPGVWANAAVLTDAESGRVLYDKNAHVKVPVASTTKMLTALVVRDRCKLCDEVTVSKAASAVGEQGITLTPGEKLSVEQLLNAMLIQSANDAACALAEHAGGSVAAFATLMNEKATELGAKDSHFMNPHGLDQKDHYSTAYDLAVIGRALLSDPVLSKIVVASKYTIPYPGHPWERVAQNHNEILTKYQGSTGIKTGYTVPAGWCLVASATKDGKSLIASILNSSHRADDAACLFDYGFNSTARMQFVKKGQKIGETRLSAYPRRYVPVVAGSDMAALTFKGSGDVFKVKTTMASRTGPKVKAGEPLGRIEVIMNDAELENGKVVASRAASAPNALAGVVAFLWYSLCWSGRIFSAPFSIF